MLQTPVPLYRVSYVNISPFVTKYVHTEKTIAAARRCYRRQLQENDREAFSALAIAIALKLGVTSCH